MRRHLDPLQLEQLRDARSPDRPLIERISGVAVSICLALFIAAVCIGYIAYALGQLPGPTP